MKLEILGSGGSVTTPRPLCTCPICIQARERGREYTRLGPSVFLHGPDFLFDTPEEISVQLNRSRIDRISACFYSHWHPDHTAGRRVFEMNTDFANLRRTLRTTDVYLPRQVAATFEQSPGLMDHMKFMESLGLISLSLIRNDESVSICGASITPIQLTQPYAFGYDVEYEGKRVLLIMDELKGWSPNEIQRSVNYDLVYLPFGVFDYNPIEGARKVPPDYALLDDEATIEETLSVLKKLNSKRFILSHIEEPDGISIELGGQLGKFYSRETGKTIVLAEDTMNIEI